MIGRLNVQLHDVEKKNRRTEGKNGDIYRPTYLQRNDDVDNLTVDLPMWASCLTLGLVASWMR